MAKRPATTVLEVAIARGGYRRGLRVLTFIEQWTIAQVKLGHEPSVAEAADWWKESHATWFRRLDDFRHVFPEFDYPTPIAEMAIARSEELVQRIGSVISTLGQLPAPAQLDAPLPA